MTINLYKKYKYKYKKYKYKYNNLINNLIKGGALPPGYDDVLYCPRGSCLIRKNQPTGFVGPKRLFSECYNPTTNEHTTPRSWGVLCYESNRVKYNLHQTGYNIGYSCSINQLP